MRPVTLPPSVQESAVESGSNPRLAAAEGVTPWIAQAKGLRGLQQSIWRAAARYDEWPTEGASGSAPNSSDVCRNLSGTKDRRGEAVIAASPFVLFWGPRCSSKLRS